MGTNQPGEVAALRAIVEPDIVVVTSIAEEHLEGLGDLEGVLREELSACDGGRSPSCRRRSPRWSTRPASRRRVRERGARRGRSARDAMGRRAGWAGGVELEGTRVACRSAAFTTSGTRCSPSPWRARCGVSMASARGIAAMPSPPMRVSSSRMARVTVINDAYNSNPGRRAPRSSCSSTRAPAVSASPCSAPCSSSARRPTAARRDRARCARAPIELVVGVGGFADALARVAPGEARAVAARIRSRRGRRRVRASIPTPLSCSRARAEFVWSASFPSSPSGRRPRPDAARSTTLHDRISCSTICSSRSSRHYSALKIFNYITFRAAGAAVTAILLSFIVGPLILKRLDNAANYRSCAKGRRTPTPRSRRRRRWAG